MHMCNMSLVNPRGGPECGLLPWRAGATMEDSIKSEGSSAEGEAKPGMLQKLKLNIS